MVLFVSTVWWSGILLNLSSGWTWVVNFKLWPLHRNVLWTLSWKKIIITLTFPIIVPCLIWNNYLGIGKKFKVNNPHAKVTERLVLYYEHICDTRFWKEMLHIHDCRMNKTATSSIPIRQIGTLRVHPFISQRIVILDDFILI